MLRLRTRVILLLAVLTLTVIAVLAFILLPKPPGGSVHGSVYTRLEGEHWIQLPDIEVRLERASNGQVATAVVTDLDGGFVTPKVAAGNYRLCWQAPGWVSGCLVDTLPITEHVLYVPSFDISPHIQASATGSPSSGFVAGQVALADGASCAFHDFALGPAELTASVRAEGPGGLLAPAVRANRAGEFVLTDVPHSDLEIRADCQSGTARLPLPSTDFRVDSGPLFDLTIPNSSPRITSLRIERGSRPVRRAAAAEEVTVKADAVDADGDPLSYAWSASAGTLTGSGAQVRWQTPPEAGVYQVAAVISDRRGGHHRSALTVEVGLTTTLFGGQVVEAGNRAPIAGAQVRVGDRSAVTDSGGAFLLEVPVDAEDRYVLTVRKRAFLTVSQIYYDGVGGGLWTMTRAHVETHPDPLQKIEVSDLRPDFLEVRKRGPKVIIPAGTIIDSQGKPYTRPVEVALGGYDTTRNPLPGDYSAVDAAGEEASLITFGAAFVEVRDQQTGVELELKKDALVQLEIPIEPGRNANADPTIDFWSYDESGGVWRFDGHAQRSADGFAYEATVSHFSIFNVDLPGGGKACVRVVLDKSLPTGIGLKVEVPTGSTSTQTALYHLGDVENAAYGLPPNTLLTLLPFDPQGNLIAAAQTSVTTGAALSKLRPSSPSECSATARLELKIPPFQGQGTLADKGVFLAFRHGKGSPKEAKLYYQGVDPQGKRGTLGGWWDVNGWDKATGEPKPGTKEVRAHYLNDNDLGLGRDMHCLKDSQGVSCYVTNYGKPDQNPKNADLAAAAADPKKKLADATKKKALATVTMEYRTVETLEKQGPIVKFFVYQGGQAAGKRLEFAELDGFGKKYVPYVCLGCHGGSYDPGKDATGDPLTPQFKDLDAGSSFREFDLATFVFSPKKPRKGQERALYDLNQIVKASKPNPAITELIDAWYPSGFRPQPDAEPKDNKDERIVVKGWTGGKQDRQDLYKDVVANSCRTCHIAHRAGHNSFAQDWSDVSQFNKYLSFIKSRVCDPKGKVMPNAWVTYKNFWLSTNPHRPSVLAGFTDGGTPPTFQPCK